MIATQVSDFDTLIGIESYLKNGLDGLHRLLKERSQVRKTDDNFRLATEAYIFGGKFWLDQFGQISITNIPSNISSKLPLVMEDSDINQHLYDAMGGIKEGKFSISHSLLSARKIPTRDTCCPHCNKGWTVDNIRNCHVDYESEIYLKGEKNVSIKQLMRYYNAHLENSSKYIFSLHTRAQIGAQPQYNQRSMDHILDHGEDLEVSKYFWYHKQCYHDHITNIHREKFRSIFSRYLSNEFYLAATPNQYSSNSYFYSDWFLVICELGTIKVGWRKREINLDWSETTKKNVSGFDVTEDEVTRGDSMIHADNWIKFEVYLQILLSK